MEVSQFDATLGGTENLPFSANSLKFAASRSIEIAAMTESILRPSNTKLIFQSLPVHMRRRVMSHNCKRLPKKLRGGHLEQLKKSGLPPKQKRPSRKYRRRPGNLLEEYNRRQKQNIWIETHIWHAKRFHMINRWGHRLAYAPCDKAFRACYRATSAHCLLQDISYHTSIELSGDIDSIRSMFTQITNSSCGLGICAKAYTNGNREGEIHLYKPGSFPYGYLGKVSFMWVSSESNAHCKLMMFVHPSQLAEIETVLKESLSHISSDNTSDIIPKKRRKLIAVTDQVKIKVLSGFNRFRLTGPNSHAVLANSLKCVGNNEQVKMSEWAHDLKQNSLQLKEKQNYWQDISTASSPSQLPTRLILGLIVHDPRLSRPSKRTKAKSITDSQVDSNALTKFPLSVSTSPLWDTSVHEKLKKNMMTNGQFIQHITKTQMVPGEVFLEDPKVQSVPVLLIQRPGSQDPVYKKLGYGSGWDIITPPGYGLPFWQTLIMFGGRSGGLRETESLAFEMGECSMAPDSQSGQEEEKRIESELRERYFRLPPNKRVNYTKLGVNSPFICPWKVLLKDWNGKTIENFFVLRDRKLLEEIQDCVTRKTNIPQINNADDCLVAVYLHIKGKGSLKRHAIICLPQRDDINNIKKVYECHHEDPREKLRKEMKLQHIEEVKRQRRRRIKMKKTGTQLSSKNRRRATHEPSEYVKNMRELWLPSNVQTVRHTASRQIIGYLSQGAFSFSEAQSCGVGYIPYNALATLLKQNQNEVLVRNTSSRKYRLANIQIIKSV